MRPDHDGIYEDAYFDFVDRTTGASGDAIADAIVRALAPRSVVDVGCGTGVLIERLRARGVSARGLDCAQVALAACRARGVDVEFFDIESSEMPQPGERADVAVSMEVGQQLAPESSRRYVDVLCSVSDIIVFSSGVPQQGDKGVRNERPHEYWIGEFAVRGYECDHALSRAWRDEWTLKRTSPWFSANVMVFRRASAAGARP